MTEAEMIAAYKREIRAKGGILPETEGRDRGMQDAWRKLH